MARIIPGVQVTVIKEVIPPQLAPSGILGLVGLVAPPRSGVTRRRVERVGSWARFRDLYGRGTALVLPEVQAALQNGVFEIVMVEVQSAAAVAATATLPIDTTSSPITDLRFTARAAGPRANDLELVISSQPFGTTPMYELRVRDGNTDLEVYRNLSLTPTDARYVGTVLDSSDSVVTLTSHTGTSAPPLSAPVSRRLSGGVDASPAEYRDALTLLEDVADVDLVVASIQGLNGAGTATVYSDVIAHCERLSADAKGRIGFGQVPATGDVASHANLAGSLVSDRFVLFAPNGVLGAAVGRIGSLSYFDSPTFKTLSGLGEVEPALRVEQQNEYLRAHVVPVVDVRGRGNVILRGLTTDGDQINVRRIADRAVRGVRQIGELFIGKLNTEPGREALRQRLTEFLLQMERENALVPSTDGSSPAFQLAVYSSQADFAQGIVRVDLAVRPVRAIDFIYATVLVQV